MCFSTINLAAFIIKLCGTVIYYRLLAFQVYEISRQSKTLFHILSMFHQSISVLKTTVWTIKAKRQHIAHCNICRLFCKKNLNTSRKRVQYHFQPNVLRYVWLMLSQIRLSVVCDVRAPYSGGLTSNFSGIFLHHIVAWPSGNSPTKNYEDRPVGSPMQRRR